MSPDVFREFCDHISEGSYLQSLGMSRHLNDVIDDVHTSTWFTVQGLEEPVCTCLGTRAGDPLADVCYNFIVCRSHNQIETELKEAELVTKLPPLPEAFRTLEAEETRDGTC